MSKELHILILEDVAADAELIERELRKGGIVFVSKRVETKEDFLKELREFSPDLILSDYSLPQFDGLSALAIAREQCPDVPFVLVSGAIGEDLAIETLKKGATDYVLKSRLSRLVPSVMRALREVEERRERKKIEEQVNDLLNVVTKAKEEWEMTFDNVMELIMIVNRNLEIVRCNKSFAKIAGMSIREIAGRKCYEFFSCNYKQIGLCKVHMQTGEILPKTEIETKDGRWFYVSHCPVTDEKGKFHFSVVVATDITDIKNTQQKLMEYQEELKKKVIDLEKFYDMAIGRELRMKELKEEITSLKKELVKYKSNENKT